MLQQHSLTDSDSQSIAEGLCLSKDAEAELSAYIDQQA
jgi:hypothetical protein